MKTHTANMLASNSNSEAGLRAGFSVVAINFYLLIQGVGEDLSR